VSGDLHLVQEFTGGVLVAVVDGLGHGHEAVLAATRAIETLTTYAHEPVVPLLQRCHEHLHGTRGVVMSLASFRHGAEVMTWAGVGDVEGVLLRIGPQDKLMRQSLSLRGGVLGYQLPTLHERTLSVINGDLLILATDGMRTSFVEDRVLSNPLLRRTQDGPQRIADELLARYAKDTDDALVLVARYGGETT